MRNSKILLSKGDRNHAQSKQKAEKPALFWWDNFCHRLRGGHYFASLNFRILFGSLSLYLVNQFLLKSMSDNFIVQNHLNDFLAMGVLLPYSNLLLALYPGRDLRLVRPVPILFFAMSVALFWEFVTPLYLARSVGDYRDLVAYGAGGILLVIVYQLKKNQYESSAYDS